MNVDELISLVHKTIAGFFSSNYNKSEHYMTKEDLLLLRVNKELCKQIREYFKEN